MQLIDFIYYFFFLQMRTALNLEGSIKKWSLLPADRAFRMAGMSGCDTRRRFADPGCEMLP
ncbi:hypothetical protein [Bosea sp. 685]|uniref:hypothetical protein n=1 Tax=Bosea sp. 685 TaxID=3080057 RepID=UPI0028931520|nr:hypothetical protein [Bosea sp. 685]WNJ91128.1 hypothetical protein RMR04_02130 [Bosea sp. 685]